MAELTNEAGLNVQQILERVSETGKFSQEDAGYIPQANDDVCGTCRFFLRPDEGNVGACQVVAGDISWNGHSQLYISAEQEADVSIQGDNAYSGDEEIKETEEKQLPTSFSQLEQMQAKIQATESVLELSTLYPKLVEGVMLDDAIEDKLAGIQNLSNEFELRTEAILTGKKEKWQPLTDKVVALKDRLLGKQEGDCKTEGGVCYPKGDYAYTPSDQPSAWKLRLSQGKPGNITTSQLGRAAAAFSPGGFRGNKVQIPAADVAKVKARIRSEYKKLGVSNEKVPDSVKELNSFTLLKQEDGSLRWLAVYSNNVIDDDNPPDILSSESHKKFANRCKDGLAPYPELWIWHNKDWNIGQADAIACSEHGSLCLALATGTIHKGLEDVVTQINDTGLLNGVSHGMLKDLIERDPSDPKVIIDYTSKELSPLPLASAANKITEFIVLEESNMLKEEKRQEFLDAGVPEAALSMIEQLTAEASKEVDDKQLETKEEEKEETPVVEEVQPNLTELLTGVAERLTAIEAKLTGNDAQIAELKEALGQTPQESQTLFGDALKETEPILKKSPEVTEGDAGNQVPFFVDYINNVDQRVEA